MDNATITLIILAFVAFFFVTELLPLAVTAMAGAIACGIFGIIPMNTVFSGLSNSTVVLFAAMFVIGAAMFHTGLAQQIGVTVVKFTGTGENSLMIGTMVVAAALSSVTSNTATTACLIPVIAGICQVARIPVNRQMMPLAFAAGLGGTITLVGTPPNIIAAGALKAAGLQPFGFFEFAAISPGDAVLEGTVRDTLRAASALVLLVPLQLVQGREEGPGLSWQELEILWLLS